MHAASGFVGMLNERVTIAKAVNGEGIRRGLTRIAERESRDGV